MGGQGHRGPLGKMETFQIYKCSHSSTHQTVHFTVCKLYLNKLILKEKKECMINRPPQKSKMFSDTFVVSIFWVVTQL